MPNRAPGVFDVEAAVERLYAEAAILPSSPRGVGALARSLFGDAAIRFTSSIPIGTARVEASPPRSTLLIHDALHGASLAWEVARALAAWRAEQLGELTAPLYSFAAAILIPSPALVIARGLGLSIADTAKRFCAPEIVVIARCREVFAPTRSGEYAAVKFPQPDSHRFA